MKRVITLLTVVVLCMLMVLPAYAAEPGFVPSVTYKDGPEVIDAKIDGADRSDCLVITSIKAAKEKSTDITQAGRDQLLDVYTKLRKETMKLPLDYGYVVLELLDITFKQTACIEKNHGHMEELEKDGTSIVVNFKLDVAKETKLDVLTYTDGKWEKIKSVVNNGDGTVTCEFEHFCPVAFVVPADQYEGPTETGDNAQITLWIFLMAAALAGIVALSVLYFRNGNRK